MGQRPPSVEEGRRWLGTENLSLSYLMLVVTEAVLFRVFGSVSLPLTVAVLVMVPTEVGLTVIVNVALAPEASEPALQVTVPEALVQVPWVEVAEPKPTPEGRVSVTVAPVAASGPLFLAVRV